MKINLILIVFLLPLFLLSFTIPANTRKNASSPSPNDTSFNLLAAYGNYVYQREGCINCHTLKDSSDTGKISLFEVPGKYSDSWHYNHLYDPRLMNIGSTMPRYARLMRTGLNVQTLHNLYPADRSAGVGLDSIQLLEIIEKESFHIMQTLKEDKIIQKNQVYSEAIALIAWLQYRPDTPERHYKDSIRLENNRRSDEKLLASVEIDISSPESDFMKMASGTDSTILNRGKRYFSIYCSPCHRDDAGGNIGPNLTDDFWLNGRSIRDMAITIYKGVPDHGMPGWLHSLNKGQTASLIAYIRSLKGSNPLHPKAPQGTNE
jgi:cbb3-type cytochrome oxidase cytochrome c subunit